MATKKTRTNRTKATTSMATKTEKAAPKGAAHAKQANAKKATGGDKKLSAIAAAAKLLVEAKEAMTCTEMIEAMAAKKLWSSPNGKTPQATLYSAILREIKNKDKDARFKKTERGKFATGG